MAGELKRVSDFEWASVGQYMAWLELNLKLHDINSNHVFSFPLATLGPLRLARRKSKTRTLLVDNMAKLERFVGSNKGELGEGELVVIRSVYRTLAQHAIMCREHEQQANRIGNLYAHSFDLLGETDEDELF